MLCCASTTHARCVLDSLNLEWLIVFCHFLNLCTSFWTLGPWKLRIAKLISASRTLGLSSISRHFRTNDTFQFWACVRCSLRVISFEIQIPIHIRVLNYHIMSESSLWILNRIQEPSPSQTAGHLNWNAWVSGVSCFAVAACIYWRKVPLQLHKLLNAHLKGRRILKNSKFLT